MPDARVATVSSYHARSKHSPGRYADGPGTLDWDAQPAAFRDWHGTASLALPHAVTAAGIPWGAVSARRAPLPFNAQNLASLLRLSVGLTAWKEYHGARWSLRAHPSSGNLHPTETWLITQGVNGIEDGLHHYHNLRHALERRAWDAVSPSTGVWLGFSSIHWREAWKYGERAFRYCQLDIGHVLAAVCYAAALHGWRACMLTLAPGQVADTLGLDRDADFSGVEREEADCILALEGAVQPAGWRQWSGKPALLDPHPLYQWPAIDEIAAVTQGAAPGTEASLVQVASPVPAAAASPDISAAQVILKRRSAQAFDGESVMPRMVFSRILVAMLAHDNPVWRMWTDVPRVHPLLLVHRVEGLAAGIYALPRSTGAGQALRAALRDSFAWQRCDDRLPLYRLFAVRTGNAARTLSCHQHIASHAAFTFIMVAEFAAPIAGNPAAYRHLHWEAGMLGHIATLEAEAAGWRGTGIGCFFDDAVHEMIGLRDAQFQVLYHYAIGMALDDPRILTLPAYPEPEIPE